MCRIQIIFVGKTNKKTSKSLVVNLYHLVVNLYHLVVNLCHLVVNLYHLLK